jgi:hypothetical protein
MILDMFSFKLVDVLILNLRNYAVLLNVHSQQNMSVLVSVNKHSIPYWQGSSVQK